MSKRLHSRSPVARRTAGITLDHAAPLYDWLAPLMTLGSEHRLHRQVVARLALDRPAAVLDVGCGTGALTRQIYDALPADSPRRVCGVDAAEAMIAVAGRKAGPRPGLEFVPALAEELPWPGASFDRVLSTFFFHHLNYGLKIRSLAEIWRVLRPGGQAAILDVDIPYSLFGKLCAWSGYWLFHQDEIAENIRGRLREALEASPWRGRWQIASRHSGYLSLFTMVKPQENTP
ncbi:MAG: class I SAM-dependent methyltransferase [Kiritimatiellae bacterium]|nr:class I SAM-dependent methyltransferase [Kiritimatiellia bacterium]HPC58243.1 class I SAM-dependent methyltransferase [Kiritimatiellia bacterium]